MVGTFFHIIRIFFATTLRNFRRTVSANLFLLLLLTISRHFFLIYAPGCSNCRCTAKIPFSVDLFPLFHWILWTVLYFGAAYFGIRRAACRPFRPTVNLEIAAIFTLKFTTSIRFCIIFWYENYTVPCFSRTHLQFTFRTSTALSPCTASGPFALSERCYASVRIQQQERSTLLLPTPLHFVRLTKARVSEAADVLYRECLRSNSVSPQPLFKAGFFVSAASGR